MEPVGTFDAGYLLAAIPVLALIAAAWCKRSRDPALNRPDGEPYDPDTDREVLSIEDEARRTHF